jgi:hypothetical protein
MLKASLLNLKIIQISYNDRIHDLQNSLIESSHAVKCVIFSTILISKKH